MDEEETAMFVRSRTHAFLFSVLNATVNALDLGEELERAFLLHLTSLCGSGARQTED